MSSSKNLISLKGSERVALPGAHIVGAIDPNERIQVTVRMRRSSSSKDISSLVKEIGAHKPTERKHLSRDEFAASYGADPADLTKVEEFAHDHGLGVVEVNAAQRKVVLTGTIADLSVAFGVYLARYEHPKGTYRGRTGPLHVPEDLAPIVEGVFGLDNRPQVRPHFRHFNEMGKAAQPKTSEISYTPPQIAQLYNFPPGVDGTGQCIAIMEYGGGYSTADLKTYFSELGIPMPIISNISIDGGSNSPTGDPNSADGEVCLDIEVVGAIVPGANIVVYFAPNTDQGFIDSISAAVHDNINKPSVISISWGGPEKYESSWSPQTIMTLDQIFQEAATCGVTVCCSAGDDGSSDLHLKPPDPCVPAECVSNPSACYESDDNLLHADFPGSSPHVLCCGGTRLEGQGSTITNEVVWNEGLCGGATGGGVSDEFGLPEYQANANVPPSANPGGNIGRGVPDVAGDADPSTGYQVRIDGQQIPIGGTSAVAPLWAGLIALFNQKLGKPVGYLNPVLYSLPANTNAFHNITVGNNDIRGNNGTYQASTGWNACTGLGSPNGANLLSAIQSVTEK
jgi:kumamolisin